MKKNSCGCGPGGCGGPTRRQVLRAAALLPGLRFMAGPFQQSDFEKLVPADKKLNPEWVKSLSARGGRAVYRGADLEMIGMPVGGICSGQLYLGGDGKLWHWDIFNRNVRTGPAHYKNPLKPSSPLDQGFALRARAGNRTVVKTLDRDGFSDVRFCGEYPLAFVEYRDEAVPLAVSLEAFSPFIPLDAAESSLPATVFSFTLKNTGVAKVEAEIAGWLENAVCLYGKAPCLRRNRILETDRSMVLECLAADALRKEDPSDRPDILFEDFEKETYEGWTATGTAFGAGPVEKAKMPGYQGDVGSRGRRLVNTHNTRQGEDVGRGDAHTGTLTSRAFTVERNYVTFLAGGGGHKGKTCINLLVDGRVVDSVTGKNDNRMFPHAFDVRAHAGKKAQIQVVDQVSGGWGNIGIDHIVFSDRPGQTAVNLQDQPDFGTMTLALLGPREGGQAAAVLPDGALPEALFAETGLASGRDPARPMGQKLVGAVGQTVKLDPGAEARVTFAITWHFPNLRLKDGGRFYATRFPSAAAVAKHLEKNLETLAARTRLWHDTWYDSTLPYWFLDRTFLNASILASSTCHRFATGRFYGWEGVGCCAGTCTHVWHYAQAVARLFPELERDLRERTDLGIAFDRNSGVVRFRAEAAGLAVDGQAGVVLRFYREHQMSADGAFLARNWPNVRKALECLMGRDEDDDGFLEGGQHNTLDADWYGPVAWLIGMYLAALAAGEAMAEEAGDGAFARRCRAIIEKGRKRLVAELFEDGYFINKPDPKRPDAINSGTGCHIDQVLGQCWAFQVGLDRVIPRTETVTALKSLWRYNFAPDVGPYRGVHKPGRWYAMPGEAGLLMCTFPRADWNYDKAKGKGPDWAAGYFNECMNGFEYQVAGHMIWEGMLTEGLAIARAVHDRYHPARRNPWNEVECGDHYARSMASYGVFLAACGFEYHGPKGHIGFTPRLTPEDFRAAFTSAEGWGTFTQKREGAVQKEKIDVKEGRLRVKTLSFALPEGARPARVAVSVAGRAVRSDHRTDDGRLTVAEAIGICAETGRRALQIELETCAATGRTALEERFATCPVSEQRVLQSALETCEDCQQSVSPNVLEKGHCAACRGVHAVDKDDPRMARVLGEYPKLDRWRYWTIAETATVYILVATGVTRRLLVVLNKESLEVLRVARRGRFAQTWSDVTPGESDNLLH